MAPRPFLSQDNSLAPAGDGALDETVIGGQIRELRKVKGKTLQQVADDAGISVGYLSQIERNQSQLPIGVLKKICDALDVHMNWFFQPSADVPPEERDT